MVAKVARLRPRMYEVGVSYYGRTYDEGKKIGWRDGVRAIYCIFQISLLALTCQGAPPYGPYQHNRETG